MPVTIQIRFQDDADMWHDFMLVPDGAFDTQPSAESVEYASRHPTICRAILANSLK
jgi:hypothetical protein